MIEKSLRTKSLTNIAIYILLLVCSSKWIFEQLFSASILEAAILCIGVAFLIVQGIKKVSLVWLFYIAAIFISLLLSSVNLSVLGKLTIVILTTMYIIIVDYRKIDAAKVMELIVRLGIFHSIFVIIHYIFKQRFNDLYFPLLNETAREYANAYFKGGRYFGILCTPHEVAGLISFALFGVILWLLISKKRKLSYFVIILMLVLSLLLTGKKGVLVIAAITLLLSAFVIYGSKKQWHRIFLLLIIFVIGCLALRTYILAHPDSVLFHRIYVFISNMSSDNSVGGTRSQLYKDAINIWRSSPITGIGWRHFKDLTTSTLGYRLAHEVNCDYLQWLCEMGIVGFILTMIPIVVTLYRTIIVCRHRVVQISDNKEKWFVLFAVCVQFFTLIYAAIEVPFYDILFYAFYIVSCIIINGTYNDIATVKKSGILLV